MSMDYRVAAARGVTASAFGTLAMDLFLYRRYKRDGGVGGLYAWESSAGLADWEQSPAPANVGRRLVEAVTRRELSPRYARLVNNVTHWAFGMLNGAAYGLVAGSLPTSRVSYGLPFGAAVWANGYVVLPAAKLYEPIWKYDVKTLGNDLSAHLVYGLTTAAAWRLV